MFALAARILGLFLACLLLGLPAVRGAAAETPVDLELVLAVDVSLSIDLDELMLQRAGYVAAFRDRDFIDAVRSGPLGRIAVTYVEWAGRADQRVIVPWRLVENAATAADFAEALERAPLDRHRRTSISSAILFSVGLFEGNGFSGTLKKIDVSGDGPNNAGPPIVPARDHALQAGVTINGLPLLLKRGGFLAIDRLDIYYEDCVIGGPGAFMLTVREPEEIVTAIRSKLILEIAWRPPLLQLAQSEAPRQSRIDCLIGERLWQQYMDGP